MSQLRKIPVVAIGCASLGSALFVLALPVFVYAGVGRPAVTSEHGGLQEWPARSQYNEMADFRESGQSWYADTACYSGPFKALASETKVDDVNSVGVVVDHVGIPWRFLELQYDIVYHQNGPDIAYWPGNEDVFRKERPIALANRWFIEWPPLAANMASAVTLVILLALGAQRVVRAGRLRSGRCATCGHGLSSGLDRCTECGAPNQDVVAS